MARTRQTARKSTGGMASKVVAVDEKKVKIEEPIEVQFANFARENGAYFMSGILDKKITKDTSVVYVPSDTMVNWVSHELLKLPASTLFTEWDALDSLLDHHLSNSQVGEENVAVSGKTLVHDKNGCIENINIRSTEQIDSLTIHIIDGILSDDATTAELQVWAAEISGARIPFKFLSSKSLTWDDINKEEYDLEDMDLEDLALDGYLEEGREEDEINEDLEESGFIIGQLTINGEEYTIIHGFPGDNPVGVLIDVDDVKTFVGEMIDTDHDNKASAWYEDATNSSKFDDSFWQPNTVEPTQEEE